MDLVPCVHCKRHVGATETACPFCATALPPQRSQFAFAARLTRAAVFSAAVVGAGACKDSSKSSAALQPTTAGSAAATGSATGSATDASTPPVDHTAPVTVTDGGVDDAAIADAGASGDAGVVLNEQQRNEIIKKKEQDRGDNVDDGRRREIQRDLRRKMQQNAKPYGAPPARRRIV